ncbi:MAG: O-antigen ligase family protein [Smithellaceae bacterium]
MKNLNKLTTKEKIFKGLNLGIPALMGLFIFLNPFPHTTAIKEICFYGSIIIILTLACFRKLVFSFRSPLTIPFLLFAFWVFIGLFFALDKENSIHDYLKHLLKYIVFYYIMINNFHSRKRLFYLSAIIIVSSALFSIGQIVYFYGILGNSLHTKLVTDLLEVSVNAVSIIVLPAAIFSLHNIIVENKLYVKVVSAICLFSTFALCLLTQARSAVLAMSLSIIILCFKNKIIMVTCLGIILLFTMITSIDNRFTKEDPVTSLRLDIHYITYEIIKDYPITGIGFGMKTYGSGKHIDLEAYQKRVPEKYRRGTIITDPHSTLFSIAVRTGLPGLVLLLYILFTSFKMIWISIRQKKDDHWGRRLMSSFVAVLMVGFFEPLQGHVLEVVFYTLLAMITIVWKWKEEEDSEIGCQ